MESTNDVKKKVEVELDQIWQLWVEAITAPFSLVKVRSSSKIKHFSLHTLNKTLQRNVLKFATGALTSLLGIALLTYFKTWLM